MVVAARKRLKTVTRRVITGFKEGEIICVTKGKAEVFVHREFSPISPPYAAGEIRWVRESWRTRAEYDHLRPSALPDDAPIFYRASFDDTVTGLGRWRPGRFLPRKYARTYIRIADVRAEWLHDLDDEEAIREGIRSDAPCSGVWWNYQDRCWDARLSPRDSFRTLWDSIHKAYGCEWEYNPAVWRIAFVLEDAP